MAPGFVSVTEDVFLNKRSLRAKQFQKETKYGEKLFKDLHIICFFNDKWTEDLLEMFSLQMWATFRKIVLKIKNKKYLWKHFSELYGRDLGNIYTSHLHFGE